MLPTGAPIIGDFTHAATATTSGGRIAGVAPPRADLAAAADALANTRVDGALVDWQHPKALAAAAAAAEARQVRPHCMCDVLSMQTLLFCRPLTVAIGLGNRRAGGNCPG